MGCNQRADSAQEVSLVYYIILKSKKILHQSLIMNFLQNKLITNLQITIFFYGLFFFDYFLIISLTENFIFSITLFKNVSASTNFLIAFEMEILVKIRDNNIICVAKALSA